MELEAVEVEPDGMGKKEEDVVVVVAVAVVVGKEGAEGGGKPFLFPMSLL